MLEEVCRDRPVTASSLCFGHVLSGCLVDERKWETARHTSVYIHGSALLARALHPGYLGSFRCRAVSLLSSAHLAG